MRSSKNDSSFSNSHKDYGSLAVAAVHIYFIGIVGKNFNLLVLEALCVDKDTPSVEIARNLVCNLVLKCVLGHIEPHSSRTTFSVVFETFICRAVTCPRKETQFSAADDL